jgi:hypothetical protein
MPHVWYKAKAHWPVIRRLIVGYKLPSNCNNLNNSPLKYIHVSVLWPFVISFLDATRLEAFGLSGTYVIEIWFS